MMSVVHDVLTQENRGNSFRDPLFSWSPFRRRIWGADSSNGVLLCFSWDVDYYHHHHHRHVLCLFHVINFCVRCVCYYFYYSNDQSGDEFCSLHIQLILWYILLCVKMEVIENNRDHRRLSISRWVKGKKDDNDPHHMRMWIVFSSK